METFDFGVRVAASPMPMPVIGRGRRLADIEREVAKRRQSCVSNKQRVDVSPEVVTPTHVWNELCCYVLL
jgi:hypothetical protein